MLTVQPKPNLATTKQLPSKHHAPASEGSRCYLCGKTATRMICSMRANKQLTVLLVCDSCPWQQAPVPTSLPTTSG